MGHIREYYEKLIKLQEEEWQYIASLFNKKVFRKGEVVTKKGQVEKYLSFLESGIVRYYIPGNEEIDVTFNFSFEKEFTCAYDSFLTQSPSQYELQALQESTVWQISYSDLQSVYTKTRVGNYLGRLSAEQLYLSKSKRELSLLTSTAKERYLSLFTEQPDIIKKIPLKYIASYIGITPQALSRIRKEIS